jgi:hypothetical protein
MPNPSPSETEKKNYQAYIVNLSSIHQLVPHSDILDNFATLHYQYANSWLGKWYSKLWVRLHYLKLISSIKEYKLGEINTDIFIKKLQEIFHFIPINKKTERIVSRSLEFINSMEFRLNE